MQRNKQSMNLKRQHDVDMTLPTNTKTENVKYEVSILNDKYRKKA